MYLYVGAFIIIIIAILAMKKNIPAPSKRPSLIDVTQYQKKFILTKSEGLFFKNLHQATINDYIVFAQVPFSCLVKPKSKDQKAFWKVNQKRVDFVLLDKNLNTVCVIELDDKTHRSKAESDKNRDDLFKACGIPTIRFYENETSLEIIKKKITKLLKL